MWGTGEDKVWDGDLEELWHLGWVVWVNRKQGEVAGAS